MVKAVRPQDPNILAGLFRLSIPVHGILSSINESDNRTIIATGAVYLLPTLIRREIPPSRCMPVLLRHLPSCTGALRV